jgi:histidine triad (HIT) family protein
MAEDCVICQIIQGKVPSKKIYEDSDIIAFLDVNGAAAGHAFVVPKEHYPIFEQVPDNIVEKIFSVSNKISSALFDTLGIQGTNVFIANGVSAGQTVPHFVVNIIPRKEGDDIDLQWKTRQLSEEEMSTVELKIKEYTGNMVVEKSTAKPTVNVQQKGSTITSRKDNMLWKSVNRRIA